MGLITRRDVARAVGAGMGGVVGSAVLAGISTAFVAAPIAGFYSRNMPGWVLAFVITVLGKLGQPLNLAAAIATAAIALTLGVLVVMAVNRWVSWFQYGPGIEALLSAGVAWLLATALSGAVIASIGSGVGAGLVLAASALDRETAPTRHARRQVLGALVGLVGVGGVTVWSQGGIGAASTNVPAVPATPVPGERTFPADVMGREEVQTAVAEQLDDAAAKDFDIDGMEPLVSERFYEVDINAVNPSPAVDTWRLRVSGAVESPLTLSIDDILEYEPEHRFVTLRCVGEALNGHQMDTALWTGIPVAPILEAAGPRGDYVMLRAADGYYEGFPLAALETGFLAYGMNGEPLPQKHGSPLRALIPGHWGEINVKWLTEIEILTQEEQGFWEKKGWHGTGPVNTVAKLHAINHPGDDRIEVGGHAYAGTRGIDAVEVSTDGGDSWGEAALTEPLPGEDVWRQWRHEYDAPTESHEVIVRAVDGTGALQTRSKHSPFPSGATGWVSSRVDPP